MLTLALASACGHSQSTNIARGHHARPESRRSRSRRGREPSGTRREVKVVLVERVWIRASERELSGLAVLEAEPLPVEQLRQALGPVPLVDALAPRLGSEAEHLVRQLVDRVLNRLGPAIRDVDAVVLRVVNELVEPALPEQIYALSARKYYGRGARDN